MQLLEHWDPLNLPKGTIRALVTLVLLGVLWTMMILGHEVSAVYGSLVLLVLGHYFGSRKPPRAAAEEKERLPLGLPRGSVRTVILLGFAGVAWGLWNDGRFPLDPRNRTATILLLAGAMIAGFLVRTVLRLFARGRATAPHRFIENLKAVIVLGATGLLAIVTAFGDDAPGGSTIALFCAPIVGFYFGSRD